MEPEEFITFAESISDARKTGDSGLSKTYFTAVYIGSQYPSLSPPTDDQVAIDGYEFGRELSKRVK